MAVSNLAHAVKKTDALLKSRGLTRDYLVRFWLQWTPEGSAFQEEAIPGEVRDLKDDTTFILKVVVDCQRFLFSDEGDKASGVVPQPATEGEMDGIFGPMSVRRAETFLESQRPMMPIPAAQKGVDYLLWDGKPVEVRGVRVLTPGEPGAIDLYALAGKKPLRWGASPKWHVLETSHWDVCLTSRACARVLTQRGLSSSYGIDNPTKDGLSTVYLWLDPGKYRGAHAGHPGNLVSAVSCDYTNAVDIGKYAAWYGKHVGWDRPVIEVSFHGRKRQILGMYASQVVAGMRVKQAYSKVVGIPFVRPKDEKTGLPWNAVLKGLGGGVFRGAVTHLNFSSMKWDVAGLAEQEIVLLLAFPELQSEFPDLVASWRLQESRWQDWLSDIKTKWQWPEVFDMIARLPCLER